MICDSPSHIYHSALPFSPSSSWIRRCYEAELAGEARVLMELPDKWSECSRTISLEGAPQAFAHWGDMIAVGIYSNVVLLDAVTGIRTSVLCGNMGIVSYLEFSQGGTLLLSNNYCEPVKLWDVQTGGVIRTFDHCVAGIAISISPDGTTIALGTDGGLIRLWDVRTGKCHSIETGQDLRVRHIRFSPVDSRRLISSSTCGAIQQWDVGGHQIGPSYKGGTDDLAYASDGTCFVSCGEGVATVQDSESGAAVVELKVPGLARTRRCCFSPDGRFVAFSVDKTIYVWDITIPGARLVGRLAGHTSIITSLAFPSFLISASTDRSMRFWQSSSFLADSKPIDHIATLHGSTSIKSVNLFPKDSIVVTSDESGVVKTWDLMTGRCGSSFSTPAKGPHDIYMADDALILVWFEDQEKWYHIWDVGKGRLLRRFRSSFHRAEDARNVSRGRHFRGSRPPPDGVEVVKISRDGSKILGVRGKLVEVVSMQTGEITSRLEVRARWEGPFSLCVLGSKMEIANSYRLGWDFGIGEISDFGRPSNQFRLDLVDPPPSPRGSIDRPTTRWIVDTVTRRRVFRLPERYLDPYTEVIWDGQYLLIWSSSKGVVVVDFDYLIQTLPTAFSSPDALYN